MLRSTRTLLVGLASAAALAAATVVPTYAASLSSAKAMMNKLKSESAQTNAQISQEHYQASVLQNAIVQEQLSLRNIQSAIATNEKQIADVQNKIRILQAKLTKNQATLKTDKQALVEQIRSIYENGHVSYLSVLMNSTSFDDLMSRLYMLEQVTKAQKRLVQQVTGLQHAIVTQQQQQKVQYATLANKNQQMYSYQHAEQLLQAQHQQTLADVKSNIHQQTRRRTLLESQIHVTQSQIQQIELEAKQAEQLMQNKQYVAQTYGNLPQANAQSVIAFGEQFMGTPYVWGGTSPSPGFDCSGFIQYVFGHFGISLQRTSESQFAEGVPVAENNLQPGDLVFFSTYAPGASHVGIYIGNGMMLDSEDMGLVIDNISNSYWGPRYLGARQVIK